MDHLDINIGPAFRPPYFGNNFNPEDLDYDFHTFPGSVAAGWTVDDNCDFSPTGTSTPQKSFNCFLQSWLFFGLIATVVEYTQWRSDFALNFLDEKGEKIDTKQLNKFLNAWADGEVKNHDSRVARMFKSQVALDRARDIVHAHCSSNGKKAGKSEQDPTQVDEELGLSLMVLGETLASAKAKISERAGFRIQGWLTDANEGWGTPTCVINAMERNKWCKRTIHSLKGQLKSQATAILSAYKFHAEIDNPRNDEHENCSAAKCSVVPRDSNGDYETRHHESCKDKSCSLIGPDLDKLVKCVEADIIPLLHYRPDKKDKNMIEVVEHTPHRPYATISHVWSHGYGNSSANRLWRCQVEFFLSLMVTITSKDPLTAPSTYERLFWIDTLAIPVQEEHKDQRRRAIRKIHDIYTEATFTVVVDTGLNKMSSSSKYEDTAMKILASAWMSRLWTLQEAYLSRRLWFAFKKGDMRSLDELEAMYPKASTSLASNISTSARSYFYNLLGPESMDRRVRFHNATSITGHGLLASIWKATQWRSTTHPEHEVLALATLLNVNFIDAKNISKAGDLPLKPGGKSEKDLEEMMKELWELLNETCPGAIPPGIIFLPGERLSLDDFGWAPKTWMSGQDVDFPDPLAHMDFPAKFVHGKGLQVQYPGFLLHFESANAVLPSKGRPVEFSIDSSLLEWYQIEQAGDIPEALSESGTLIEMTQMIAVILCRPKPRDQPEIALLVKVVRAIEQHGQPGHKAITVYQVQIICRIWIKRQGKIVYADKLRDFNRKAKEKDEFVCGEALNNDQMWFVDGPKDPTNLVDPEPQDPVAEGFTIADAKSALPAGRPQNALCKSNTSFRASVKEADSSSRRGYGEQSSRAEDQQSSLLKKFFTRNR